MRSARPSRRGLRTRPAAFQSLLGTSRRSSRRQRVRARCVTIVSALEAELLRDLVEDVVHLVAAGPSAVSTARFCPRDRACSPRSAERRDADATGSRLAMISGPGNRSANWRAGGSACRALPLQQQYAGRRRVSRIHSCDELLQLGAADGVSSQAQHERADGPPWRPGCEPSWPAASSPQKCSTVGAPAGRRRVDACPSPAARRSPASQPGRGIAGTARSSSRGSSGLHAGEVVEDSLVDAQRRRGHAMARLHFDQAEAAQRR